MTHYRINMIMCSNGPVSRFWYEKWYNLYQLNPFNWRFLDFNTGFDYHNSQIEVIETNQKTHGLSLMQLYEKREYPIEIFCDLDSFPIKKNWMNWIENKLQTYKLVAAEDHGPIRHYPGKVAPSFMAFSDKAPKTLDFTCKKRSHDTAHLILKSFSEKEYYLLKQKPSGIDVGTWYMEGNEKIWYHQWYLRKEKEALVNHALTFFNTQKEALHG